MPIDRPFANRAAQIQRQAFVLQRKLQNCDRVQECVSWLDSDSHESRRISSHVMMIKSNQK
jgi:hypothetical protein